MGASDPRLRPNALKNRQYEDGEGVNLFGDKSPVASFPAGRQALGGADCLMSVRERAGVQALFLLASEARGTEHWMPNWSFEPDSNSGALLGVLKTQA